MRWHWSACHCKMFDPIRIFEILKGGVGGAPPEGNLVAPIEGGATVEEPAPGINLSFDRRKTSLHFLFREEKACWTGPWRRGGPSSTGRDRRSKVAPGLPPFLQILGASSPPR